MRRIFATTGFVFLTAIAFAQATEISWYKTLKGNINGKPVTMHLHKAAHHYFGYYYDDTIQQLISFSGEDTTQAGKVRLMAHSSQSDFTEFFSLSIANGKIAGTWQPGENQPVQPFAAKEARLPVAFTYVFTEGSLKLRPRMEGSPRATFEAGVVWPGGNSNRDNFLKGVIRQTAPGTGKNDEPIGQSFLREKKAFFNSYLSEHKNAKDAENKEAFAPYSLEQMDRTAIAFYEGNLLTLSAFNYAYTGGAHGNYGTSFIPVDLVHNKQLMLSDVINEKGKKALKPLLEKHFRKQFQLKPSESLEAGGLFKNEIEPTDNFYLTSKGIGFNYVPYEIGPYAMGEVLIFIPFTELQSFLQPAFQQLIGKKMIGCVKNDGKAV